MVGNDNLRTLEVYDVPLCVECGHCGRRTALEVADLKRAPMLHDMTSLVEISRRMKCQACGSKAVKVFRPESRGVVAEFLEQGRGGTPL